MKTYYWTRNPEVIKNKKWRRFVSESKKIFANSLISIANIYGDYESKPQISKDFIAFNGEDGDKADYFCMCKDPLYDSDVDVDGLVIGYCETKGKLYEKVVENILNKAFKLEVIESWWKNEQ